MLSATAIVSSHDRYTSLWHEQEPAAPATGLDDFERIVAEQHRANFELWHAEDDARSPHADDHEVARIKRAIDRINQQRNDLMEQCDLLLMAHLRARGLPDPVAALHSETPGLMIDRLSILALKLFHTGEEIGRANAPEGHAQRNRERYAILEEQRSNLAGCLDRLWSEILAGERRIQLYLQLKMYNDPALNPVQYKRLPER